MRGSRDAWDAVPFWQKLGEAFDAEDAKIAAQRAEEEAAVRNANLASVTNTQAVGQIPFVNNEKSMFVGRSYERWGQVERGAEMFV